MTENSSAWDDAISAINQLNRAVERLSENCEMDTELHHMLSAMCCGALRADIYRIEWLNATDTVRRWAGVIEAIEDFDQDGVAVDYQLQVVVDAKGRQNHLWFDDTTANRANATMALFAAVDVINSAVANGETNARSGFLDISGMEG